jgi:hypothetical protein
VGEKGIVVEILSATDLIKQQQLEDRGGGLTEFPYVF